MPDSTRHFTVVDDWVMLNSDVTATEYRVYSIIKGNIRHTYGGVPETGFRVTAAWVSAVSDGIISVSTAHRSMQGLAKKGVLRRLNNPHSGEGAEFEFVIRPDESYEGPRSVMVQATKVDNREGRSVVFVAIPLRHEPSRRSKPQHDGSPEILMMEEIEVGGTFEDVGEEGLDRKSSERDFSFEEEPDVNMSGLTPGPRSSSDQPTDAEAEFAAELEIATLQHSEVRLHLMAGACRRIAAVARPALERGWEPRGLARRLSSELNSKIHSPENLLIAKISDLGDPPPIPISGKVRLGNQVVDLSRVDLGFGHDSDPQGLGTQISSGVKQRKESASDRLAKLARGMSH